MKQDNAKIWMNVTTSHNWQRPPVGIVRVERLLSNELALLYGSRFKKCIWSNGNFIELKPQEIQADTSTIPECLKRKNITQPKTSKENSFVPIYPILSKIDALVAIVQGILSLTPALFKPHFNRFLHFLRPKIYKLIKDTNTKHKPEPESIEITIEANTKEQISDNKPKNESSLFNQGDILISMGLDWDHSYYKEFYNIKKKCGIKIVTCCYDLIPVIYPQYCVNNVAGIFTSYFLEIADGSDMILCISNQSQKDLNEMLDRTGGARPLTHVFPLGDNVPEFGNEIISDQVKDALQKPFILYVSTIERRKNHEVLYRAYHLLCKQGKKDDLPKLVFVGMPGWGVAELLKDIELDPLTHNMILCLNYVNDTELRKLYESALFCVFPSLYEGWGLPVGEALSLGKAVICSDRGSLPEVGKNIVQYVDPWSPIDWSNALYRMCTDTKWREECIDRVNTNYSTKTWQGAAYEIKKELDKISCMVSK